MRYNLHKLSRIGGLLLALSLASFSLQADNFKSARVAVLDWQAALMESKTIQDEFKKADQQLSNEQGRARQLAEEAKGLQDRLQRDGSIMNEDEKRRLSQQLEQKAQEYQFIASRLQKQQQDMRQEIVEKHRPNLEKIVNELIKQHKIDILLDKQAAAFAAPEFDLTQQVADRLNKTK